MPDAEIKAGRRHRASDEAILKTMRDDWRGIATKMTDYFKALGFEDEDGDGAITPDEAADQAVKALDYARVAELVEDAVLEALDEPGGADAADPLGVAVNQVLGDTDDDAAPHVLVYAAYAVLCLSKAEWKVPYRIEAGAVVLDTPDTWVRVEKEWRPVVGAAAGITSDAVKLLDDGSIVAQAVRFGSPDEPDMSEMRDFFTKSTEFWLDRWDRRPMLYHHGMDEGTRDAPVIGAWVKAWADDAGIWLQGQLDRAHKYHAAIKELARRGYLRVSTDSAPHLVQRERGPNGTHYVKAWPIMAASLTVSPAEFRLLPAELKAALGMTIDDASLKANDATGHEGPTGREVGDDAARRLALEIDLLSMETAA